MKRLLTITALTLCLSYALVQLSSVKAQNASLQNEILHLESRLAELKVRRPIVDTKTTFKPPITNVVAPGPKKTDHVDRVDVPNPHTGSCRMATITTSGQLASSMTWLPENGGEHLGYLPAGTVVEVLSQDPLVWTDFPNEHGLYVQVVEAPEEAREVLRLTGYIELSRINFKHCNLGAQFER